MTPYTEESSRSGGNRPAPDTHETPGKRLGSIAESITQARQSPMVEVTQAQLEALEIEASEAQRRFEAVMAESRKLSEIATAFWEWGRAERRLLEAKRARREAEATEIPIEYS